MSLILTLLFVFATAIIGGLVAKKFKQSTIIGYIVAGFVVGSFGFELANKELLETIANVGVTLLLFTLGVEFSFQRLRVVLKTITLPATAQIILTTLAVLIVLLVAGISIVPAIFIAAAASLSSTAIVVKVLSEKGELDTNPGEVTTGWLVVQDLAVIPMMIMLPSLVTQGGNPGLVLLSLAKAVLILGVVVLLGRVGLSRVLSLVAKSGSRELFLLTTVGLVLLFAVSTYALGLSAPLGAFIAGLLIAETSQNHAIFAEVRPLRDVFATVFFVTIGMVLPFSMIATHLVFIGLLALAVIFLKWIIVTGIMRSLRFHRKSAFLVALSLTQMSEFGFILSREGVRIGALSPELGGILAATTIVTMLVSTPLLSRGADVYRLYVNTIGKWLPKLFSENKDPLETPQYIIENHVVICGYGRVGKYIGRALLMAKVPFLVVDYNNTTVSNLKKSGIPVVYGDPADKDVLDYAEVDHARAIVIAIPDRHTQELIIGHALTLNKKIHIFCRTHHEEDQPYLKSLGVQTVIQPEFEAALTISERLLSEFGVEEAGIAGKVSRLKIEHGIG